tara:strand:- start:689 stop:934 length:246 start_codon:yes stop_codon:yes gene_type:complete
MSWEDILKNQRPDYPDTDGDGNTEEPMVDALQTVEEVESVKKIGKVKCPDCGEMFPNNKAHKRHHQQEHEGSRKKSAFTGD